MTVESRGKWCKGGKGKNKEEYKNKQIKSPNKQTKTLWNKEIKTEVWNWFFNSRLKVWKLITVCEIQVSVKPCYGKNSTTQHKARQPLHRVYTNKYVQKEVCLFKEYSPGYYTDRSQWIRAPVLGKQRIKKKNKPPKLMSFLNTYLGYITKLSRWQKFLLAKRYLWFPQASATYFQEERNTLWVFWKMALLTQSSTLNGAEVHRQCNFRNY